MDKDQSVLVLNYPTFPDSSLYARVLVWWRRGQMQERPRPWKEVVVWVLSVDSGFE